MHECKTSVISVLAGHETMNEPTVIESLETTRKAEFSYASIEIPTQSFVFWAFHLFVEGLENFVIKKTTFDGRKFACIVILF